MSHGKGPPKTSVGAEGRMRLKGFCFWNKGCCSGCRKRLVCKGEWNCVFPAVWSLKFWYRKLREVCRKNFHRMAPLKTSVVTSYDQKHVKISRKNSCSRYFLIFPRFLLFSDTVPGKKKITPQVFGHNSLRKHRGGTRMGGNESYKPPGAFSKLSRAAKNLRKTKI